MVKQKDTRQQIIKQATLLFKKQGYAGTSIKQITEAVGITAPALYYFFPEGKAELLRVVVKELNMDPEAMLANLKTAKSLEELVELINTHLPELLKVVATDILWLHHESDQLPEEEKTFIQNTILATYEIISTEASRFIPENERARQFAWMMFLIHDGYMEIFMIYDLGKHDPFTHNDLNQLILDFFKQSSFSK